MAFIGLIIASFATNYIVGETGRVTIGQYAGWLVFGVGLFILGLI